MNAYIRSSGREMCTGGETDTQLLLGEQKSVVKKFTLSSQCLPKRGISGVRPLCSCLGIFECAHAIPSLVDQLLRLPS